MYFINTKIVKTIANEIYRDAGFKLDDIEGWYCVYDAEDKDDYIAFAVNREMPDEVYEFKHFTICFDHHKNGQDEYSFYSTKTLNRRDLADTLLEIINNIKYTINLQEVS